MPSEPSAPEGAGSPGQPASTRHPLGLAGVFTAVLCWGSGNVMVREVELTAVPLALWRLVLGASVYGVIVLARGGRLSWPQFKACLAPAATLGLWMIVFYEALKSTTITNATMLSSLMPLVLFAVASRRFDEHVPRWVVVVTASAMAGTALVLYGSSAVPSWSARGDGLAVLALLLFSVYFALAKDARSKVGAVEFQTVVWGLGLGVVVPVAAVSGDLFVPSLSELAGAAILLAVPGTGHFLMNWTHRHVPLTITSIATLGTVPVSMVGAAIFLDEPVNAAQVIGAAIVLAALGVVSRRDVERAIRRDPR